MIFLTKKSSKKQKFNKILHTSYIDVSTLNPTKNSLNPHFIGCNDLGFMRYYCALINKVWWKEFCWYLTIRKPCWE